MFEGSIAAMSQQAWSTSVSTSGMQQVHLVPGERDRAIDVAHRKHDDLQGPVHVWVSVQQVSW
jgi:hypothetical protein